MAAGSTWACDSAMGNSKITTHVYACVFNTWWNLLTLRIFVSTRNQWVVFKAISLCFRPHWILVWIMPQVQDWLLDLLTCSYSLCISQCCLESIFFFFKIPSIIMWCDSPCEQYECNSVCKQVKCNVAC